MSHEIYITPANSLQAAINSLPDDGTPAVIHLAPGVYHEKVELRRPHTTLIGCGADKTILAWDDGAADAVVRDEKDAFVTEYYTEKVWVDGQPNAESPYANSQRPVHNDAAPIVVTPDDVTPEPDGGMPPWIIVVIIVAAVAVVGGGAVIAAILLKKNKKA